MEMTLREDFDQISDAWHEWLREQYYPILEDADMPNLISGVVSARGFNSKPVFYQQADGTRKVYFVGNHGGYSNVFEVEVDSLYQPLGEPDVLVRGERSDRGERNEPAWVALVGAALARVWDLPVEEVARITSSNAARLFGR